MFNRHTDLGEPELCEPLAALLRLDQDPRPIVQCAVDVFEALRRDLHHCVAVDAVD